VPRVFRLVRPPPHHLLVTADSISAPAVGMAVGVAGRVGNARSACTKGVMSKLFNKVRFHPSLALLTVCEELYDAAPPVPTPAVRCLLGRAFWRSRFPRARYAPALPALEASAGTRSRVWGSGTQRVVAHAARSGEREG